MRATRPRAEPAVPLLTHVFLLAMRELHGRDPRAPVAPWLLGLAGAGARSAKAPVPLAPEELDAIWTRLHGYWPDGHRHASSLPRRRTAAIVGLAALAGLVPAVVLGAGGTGTEEELVELRAVPLPDERTAEVAEVADEDDDEPDFSFPTTPEEQEAPPSESTQPPADEPETSQPDPDLEPEDPTAGEDDDLDGQGDETAPDDGADDEDSGGLLDGVLGPGDDEDDQQDGDEGDDGNGDEDDQRDDEEGAVEEHRGEEAAADDAASDESEDA